MIKIEDVVLNSPEQVKFIIDGMRNPKNSWDRSDSSYDGIAVLGENDLSLARTLAEGGPVHAKYRRMIIVYANITAPLYWWKEFDTYKVGTVANSCSTMHKIHSRDLRFDDFSTEHLDEVSMHSLENIINTINLNRKLFIKNKNKDNWWQLIQLLPTSYNQKRSVMLNYEVLTNIYNSRRNHKLDEWHTFCDWIKTMPYSDEMIIGHNEL